MCVQICTVILQNRTDVRIIIHNEIYMKEQCGVYAEHTYINILLFYYLYCSIVIFDKTCL